MSTTELNQDKQQTFNAMLRLNAVGRTDSLAFRKLIERMTWINVELINRGELTRLSA